MKGQLIRKNNKGLDKTFIYGYNEIGNGLNLYAYAGNNPVSLAYPSAGKAISQSPASAAHSFARASVERPHRAPINLANGLYALSGAFSTFDYYSGQIITGLEARTAYLNKYYLNNSISYTNFSKTLTKFSNTMTILGAMMSLNESMHKNAINPYYTEDELLIANIMDGAYFTIKTLLIYKGTKYLSEQIVSAGFAIGGVKGIVLTIGFSVGLMYAVVELGEWSDSLYEKIKKFFLE